MHGQQNIKMSSEVLRSLRSVTDVSGKDIGPIFKD